MSGIKSPVESIPALVAQLQGKHFICAEFMYKPRPQEPRTQRVFDFALTSRLHKLSQYDHSAVVFICNDSTTAESLAYLKTQYPRLTMLSALTNPEPILSAATDPYREIPVRCNWSEPEHWRRYTLTDRWARILFALNIAEGIKSPGYLVLPANDAVWGRGLLALLVRLSKQAIQNGLPAAVSPYTYYQHSPVPGANIPQEIIDALNTAFSRDSWQRWRCRFDHYQAFWGKMGLIPFQMSVEIRQRVETMVWEDDLEIDRVIREAGYGLRCQWIDQPMLYRQALPVFDYQSLRRVIERTLHYSLNIPGKTYGEKSRLNQPLDAIGCIRQKIDRRFDRSVKLSERIIADCNADIAERMQRYGMSWVDWGTYRYVVRVGDPLVQVWKYERPVL